MSRKWMSGASAFAIAAALGLSIGRSAPAYAHFVPAPCDFITAGGVVTKDDGAMANFGAHGGCKNNEFWGNVNYVDHGQNLHLSSTQITGYLIDPAMPNKRDICGYARTNDGITVQFRVTLTDNGEPGTNDKFGIVIDDFNQVPGDRFYFVRERNLTDGNVQLHKDNPSTTASSSMQSLEEWQMCGDLNSPM